MYSLKLNAISLLSITFARFFVRSATFPVVPTLLCCWYVSISSKALAFFLMHLLCHQSIHHPWHFETLLCGLHKHMWDLTLTFETLLTAFRVIEYRRWFFISFACCRSNCDEMSLVGNVAFASIPLHISTSTFFIVILKKQIENEHEHENQKKNSSGRKEERQKNGQNWCVCTIFIKEILIFTMMK